MARTWTKARSTVLRRTLGGLLLLATIGLSTCQAFLAAQPRESAPPVSAPTQDAPVTHPHG